ncbi:regulatory protein, luxR family [Streptomyces sp. 2231.1]|uniref:AAA family ATPase n=1 Tax=Streptomyces sp. 2231.1 TaxID=1855347 RepID=UPI00089D72C5|nr:LuxR family transcriptional regulator [Streptomyces sp. 2231.1]SED54072.1 regulatory protein, luxR family [Streptomyces sp. 2231.1]
MHAPNGDLYHREQEISLLQQAVDALALGRPTVATVQGPRGIGKSALLGAVPRLLPADALVLRARCHPSETQFPYSMVRQLFDPVLGGREAAGAGHDAGNPHRTDGTGLGGEGAWPGTRPTHEALLGLLRTTRSLAVDRPVAILVDDLTQADEPSLRWFSYIARRLDDLPVLMVATLPSRAAAQVTEDLGPLPYLLSLWPEPLCPTCTTELVDRAFDSPVDQELAALCHALAHGNPLVLHDLVTRLRRTHVPPGSPDPEQVLPIGAQALSETVLAWLDEDETAAGELLALLAVLGPETDPAVCGALSQRGEVHEQHARETLVRAGLLESGPPVRFPHPAVRPAVLARVPAHERLALHGRAAAVLARLGAPARQTAEHLLKGGCDWGLDVLRAAGTQAAAAGDHEAAARYLRRALALLDDAGDAEQDEAADRDERAGGADADRDESFLDLTVRLGAVELHRDLDACARHAAAADGAPGPLRRAEALVRMASPALVATVEGAQPFVRVCGELAALPAPPREHLLRLTAQSLLTGHRSGLRRAARLAAAAPADAAARTFGGALAAAAAAGGRLSTARRMAARVVAGAVRDPEAMAPAAAAGLVGAALALIWTGDVEGGRSLATRLAGAARAADDLAGALLAHLVCSDAAERLGDHEAAYAEATTALRLARRLNASALTGAALACTARALTGLGRTDEAAALLDGEQVAGDAHPFIKALFLQARGTVAAARGEHAAAAGLFLDCGHRLALRGITNPACLPWRTQAARSYLALGEDAAAATILDGAPREQPASAARPVSQGERALLSPAELRVVELVVRGHSSQEVAEKLFLSKRTVDTHLGRIYRKLGIHSRHELTGALGAELQL